MPRTSPVRPRRGRASARSSSIRSAAVGGRSRLTLRFREVKEHDFRLDDKPLIPAAQQERAEIQRRHHLVETAKPGLVPGEGREGEVGRSFCDETKADCEEGSGGPMVKMTLGL